MAQSKYASNRETTNFARISRIILGPCSDVMCAVLLKKIRPSDLPKYVRTYLAKLPAQKKPPITKEQETLINKAKYSDFDITLLYFLLRNISNIPPHTNQWGNIPISGDKSLSANIEKIRLIRNEFGHSSEISISDTDFNKKWQEIFDIVRDLESYIGNTIYQDAVKLIKTCSMDPDLSNKYIEELIALNKRLKDVSGEVQEMKKDIIPWNVQAQHNREVFSWKEDDVVFVESHSFRAILDQVREQPYVTFVGVPGSGKTATTRHIALILQREGYEILPITDKNKIKDYCDPYRPQVFVIDDVLGVFGFDIAEFHMLIKYQKCLSRPTMQKSKCLMTCRETIFRNEALFDTFLSKEEKIVKLHSDENALTFDDKYDLLEKYKLDTNLFSANSMSLTSNMFPFLCKFFSEMKVKHYGSKFFISPVPCLLMLLDEMKARNKMQYASLVLLMANENKLSEDLDFQSIAEEKFNERKCEVLKRCKVNNRTDNHEIIDVLKEMEGTFTQQSGCQFSFIHDSMFEIIANHFGCQFPEMIIKYMSSDYIANYIKLESHDTEKRKLENGEPRDSGQGSTYRQLENVIDLRITLEETDYKHFVTRLLKDLENGELYNVFRNECLKCKDVLHVLIGELTEKTYSELYACFFAELTDKVKINRFENDQNGLNQGEYFQVLSLLFDERNIRDHYGIWSSIRAISWVIFYGHHRILQYIINQVLSVTGNADAIFQTCYPTGTKRNSGSCIDEDDTTNKKSNHSLADESRNEQWRLLCLGCYSNDLTTVQILLKHVGKHAIDNRKTNKDKNFKDIKPLVIVCSFGYLDIAQELLRAGADVNQKAIFETPLTAACEKGHLCIVKELINAGAYVNLDDGYQTPLTTASKEGHLNIVRELIQAGADNNLKAFFDTPLTAAYKNEHFKIFKELLNTGAEPNVNYGEKTLLRAVCEKGDLIVVKQLIEAGADINTIDKDETPLISACKVGNLGIVKELIKAGANINLKDCFCTPLSAAFENEHLHVFKELLHKGADVNIQYGGKTLLTDECRNGNLKNVRELIKVGADVNLQDIYQTPLTIACRKGYLPIVKELLQAGADVNLKTVHDTPLKAAYQMRHIDVVIILIREGADINFKYKNKMLLTVVCQKDDLAILKEMIKTGVDVNIQDGCTTPLTAACKMGNLEIVRTLITASADVNIWASSDTPLTAAFNNYHLNIVKELINAALDSNIKYGNSTFLTFVSGEGYLGIVKALIKAGTDVNPQEEYKTPLTSACRKGHLYIVTELIKAGADVNQEDKYQTPLTIACQNGHLGIVSELVKAGADVNLRDKSADTVTIKGDFLSFKDEIESRSDFASIENQYQTPLTAACRHGHFKIVTFLINAEADVNMKDEYQTPLTAACENGYFKIVQNLLKAGAKVNMRGNYHTPLTMSLLISRIDIVEELIQAGADVNLDYEFHTPLTLACRKNPLSYCLETINQLYNQSDVTDKTCQKIAYVKENFRLYKKLSSSRIYVNLADEKTQLGIVKGLIKAGSNVNLKTTYGSPLSIALKDNNFIIAEELIIAGANFLGQNNHEVLITASRKGSLITVKKMVESGADVNLRNNIKKKTVSLNNQKCLSEVYKNRNLNEDCSSEFLEGFTMKKTSDDFNMKNRCETPLTASCEEGHLCIVKELINAGADVNLQDALDTPLTAACRKGHSNIVKELIIAGADVNLQGAFHTPLTSACHKGHMDIVEELVKAEADVNLRDTFNTPIAISCESGNLEIAEFLRKAGGSVILKNKHPRLLTLACQKGYIAFMDELIRLGTDVNGSDNCTIQSNYSSPDDLYDYAYSIAKGGDIIWDDLYVDSCNEFPDGLFRSVETLRKDCKTDILTYECRKPITAACQKGNIGILKELIKAGADVNILDRYHTSLTISCKEGHLCIVEELIKSGANVNQQDEYFTPLTTACQKGHFSVVKKLIKSGANVNQQDRYRTPLTVSCINGRLRIVMELIKAGAEVNLKDLFDTPMTVACKNGYFVIAEILKKSGAQFVHPNLLPLACFKGYLYIVKRLIKVGADVNLTSSFAEKIALVFDFDSTNLKTDNKINCDKFKNPLTAACQQGYLSIVQELIKSGANVNLADGYRTPMTTACTQGQLGIVQELIEAGADVNRQDNYVTPLTTACQQGYLSIVDILIRAGVDVNLKDMFYTPLTYACMYENLHIAEILLKAGAEIILGDTLYNFLTFACFNGNIFIVKEFIKTGIDINLPSTCTKNTLRENTKAIKNAVAIKREFQFQECCMDEKQSETDRREIYSIPLLAACQGGHLRIVKELIKAGAYINLQVGYRTPLTAACLLGHLSIVEELIKAGANVNMNDAFYTPLKAAFKNRHFCIAKVLIEAGADWHKLGDYKEFSAFSREVLKTRNNVD